MKTLIHKHRTLGARQGTVPLLCAILLVCGHLFPAEVRAQDAADARFSGTVRLLLLFQPNHPFADNPSPPRLHVPREERADIVFDGIEWTSVTAPTSVDAPRRLRFFTGGGAGDARPLAEVRMPEGRGDWLLVFLPDGDGGARIAPIDISPATWPEGKVRFTNFGDSLVGLEVAGETRKLAPGEDWLVSASSADNFQLGVRVAARHKDKARLVYRNSFALSPEARVLFLIHRRSLVSGPWTVSVFAGLDAQASPDASGEAEPSRGGQ